MVFKAQWNVQKIPEKHLYPHVNKEQLETYVASEDMLQHKNSDMLGDATSQGTKDEVWMLSVLYV